MHGAPALRRCGQDAADQGLRSSRLVGHETLIWPHVDRTTCPDLSRVVRASRRPGGCRRLVHRPSVSQALSPLARPANGDVSRPPGGYRGSVRASLTRPTPPSSRTFLSCYHPPSQRLPGTRFGVRRPGLAAWADALLEDLINTGSAAGTTIAVLVSLQADRISP
jgi:hypothetical protein